MAVLAHAGAGATWQALLVLLSFGLVAVVIGVVAGRIPLHTPGDLVLPLAAAAVLASLSGATSTVLSDWVGWWFPIGVVALLALGVAAGTSWQLTPTSGLTWTAVVAAVGAAVALHGQIQQAWHPIDGLVRDDVTLTITSPTDGDTVDIGPVAVTVEITGGSIGPGPTLEAGQDPEELGVVRIYVDGVLQTSPGSGAALPPREDCTAGCTTATWDLELARGPHVISAEFLTSDGQSFATTSAGAPTVGLVTVEAQ